MVSNGSRRNAQPIHFKENTTTALIRLPLDGRNFSESWIQKLIHEQPSILPINEIEPSFGPLVAMGREVTTAVGPIDNLFISPSGYITIVETKLWRNPQARREVVGQIVDYAKELSKWTFENLNAAVVACNKYQHQSNEGLLDIMRSQHLVDEGEEQFFIDNISKNLRRGRFLLLIVGDGIRESVEDMVEYLGHSPQLHFTLALVELQVFKMGVDNEELIIMPQVVTRTREITRAVVRIEGTVPENLHLVVETEQEPVALSRKGSLANTLSIPADDFFGQLLQNTNASNVSLARQMINDSEARGYDIIWNSGSFSIKLSDPQGSGVKISLLNVDRKGLVYPGYAVSQLAKLGLPEEVSYNFAKDTAELIPSIEYNSGTMRTWNKYATLEDVRPIYKEFMELLYEYVSAITIAGARDASENDTR